MQVIPLSDTARQTLNTILGDQRVIVRVRWLPLARAWYLTVDRGDQRIATSRQLVPWERIIGPAPPFDGDFLVLAARGQDEADVGRDAWSQTHALWYLTGAELAEAGL